MARLAPPPRSNRLGHALAAIVSAAGLAILLGAAPASADSPHVDERIAAASIESPGEVARPSSPAEPAPAAEAPAPPADPGDAKPAERAITDSSAETPRPETPSRPAKKRRGGINPCMTPDPGFGVYDGWSSAPSIGQMIAPHKGGISKTGAFDLVVHFHGHEPIRKEFVKHADGIVLVGIDLGIGSGAYSNGFASPSTFTNLIRSVEEAMSKRTGKKAHVRKLALSSWSAGYGAVEQILQQPAGKKVDAVILLDSLHTGYVDESQRSLKTDQIAPFVAFARRAAAGQGFMYMSHSSIIPPGYASTTEVAHYVVETLHGKPKKATRKDVLGLDMFERFDKGNFHMRGYTGDDKPDHCAHLGLMDDIVRRHLEPRWKPVRGKR